MPTVHKLNHVIDIGICATLSEDELKWLEAEVVRMDQEEPITNGWSKETVLEAMLQIAIDRGRGVDEDPAIRDLKLRLRRYERDTEEIEAEVYWDSSPGAWVAVVEEINEDRVPDETLYDFEEEVAEMETWAKDQFHNVVVMLVEVGGQTLARFVRKGGVA